MAFGWDETNLIFSIPP